MALENFPPGLYVKDWHKGNPNPDHQELSPEVRHAHEAAAASRQLTRYLESLASQGINPKISAQDAQQIRTVLNALLREMGQISSLAIAPVGEADDVLEQLSKKRTD